MNDFSNVKVGDWVAVQLQSIRGGAAPKFGRYGKVERVTKTQFVAIGRHYYRPSGRSIQKGSPVVRISAAQLVVLRERSRLEAEAEREAQAAESERNSKRAALGWRIAVWDELCRMVDAGGDIEAVERLGDECLALAAKRLGIEQEP